MNSTAGFQEVRSSCSRSSTNRLLHEQQHRFGTGPWHLPCTHNLIAVSTWAQLASAARIIGFLVVTHAWFLTLGLESFAQTVSLEGLEVTQSIQVMSSTKPEINNSVPLIANKRTVVRAYFSTPAASVTIIGGQLSATHIGGHPDPNTFSVSSSPPPSSVTISSTENGNLQAKRNDITKSLNFELPSGAIEAGTLTLAIQQLSGTDGFLTCDNCTTASIVPITSSPPLKLRLIGLKYDVDPSHWPREIDFALIKSWLKRMYPTATIELAGEGNYTYDENDYGDLFEDVDGDGQTGNDDTCLRANLFIQALRSTEAPLPSSPLFSTHYYGLIHDGGGPKFIQGCSSHPNGIPVSAPAPDTTAVGPVGAQPVGGDNDGSYGDSYAAHELGHTFGRLHLQAGCHRDATLYIDEAIDGHVSPNFPNDPYYVGLDTGETLTLTTGNIVLPRLAVPGSWSDVMTYCHPRWINHYNYGGIRERLQAENMPLQIAASSSPTHQFSPDLSTGCDKINHAEIPKKPGALVLQGDFLSVLASVNFKNRTGKIHDIDRVTEIVSTSHEPGERVLIRITQVGGRTTCYPVQVEHNATTPPDKQYVGIIKAFIPIPLLKDLKRELKDDTDNLVKVELLLIGPHDPSLIVPQLNPLYTLTLSDKLPIVDSIALSSLEKTQAEFFEAPLVITWTTPTGDASKTPTYTVQFSKDNGKIWQTLGFKLKRKHLEIEPKLFKGLTDIMVKVIVSDGFSKAKKTVNFTIPAK